MNAIVTSNFIQIVKKATCLMTITKYNSNNGLTLEFKWALEELINIARLTKDLWSKFYLGINIRPLRKAHPESAPKYAVDARSPANSLDVVQKSTIRALFKVKSVEPKTIDSLLIIICVRFQRGIIVGLKLLSARKKTRTRSKPIYKRRYHCSKNEDLIRGI